MMKTNCIRPRLEPGQAHTDLRRAVSLMAAALAMMAVTVLGQGLESTLQQKSLAFPHVVTGPSVETVICVTNRGDTAYRGAIRFWRGSNQEWNPAVNGERTFNSTLFIMVESGETRIFRIGPNTSLEAGAALISAEDLSQGNLIEGNLTYFVGADQHDSVGISPSFGLFRSVIPFEDFASVGPALANPNLNSPAEVTLRLLDEFGGEEESELQVLPGRSHEARFLSEIFSAEVGAGKVEVESNQPILGTALL